MKNQINDLVSMRDVESLFEIMNENDDWLTQMDAAEGLIELGDRRGLEYLLIAKQSDIEDIQEAAKEILSDPETRRMREQIEAELRFASQKLVESARQRLKQGKKVFLHKILYLSAAEFARDDAPDDGFQVYDLNDAGLEGWEVVSILPHRQLVGPRDDSATGAYAFLRKQLSPDEADELDKN